MTGFGGLFTVPGGEDFHKIVTVNTQFGEKFGCGTAACDLGKEWRINIGLTLDSFVGPGNVSWAETWRKPDFVTVSVSFTVQTHPFHNGCGEAPNTCGPSTNGFMLEGDVLQITGSGPASVYEKTGFGDAGDGNFLLGGGLSRLPGSADAYSGDPTNPDLRFLWRPEEIEVIGLGAKFFAHWISTPIQFSLKPYWYTQPDIDYVIPTC